MDEDKSNSGKVVAKDPTDSAKDDWLLRLILITLDLEISLIICSYSENKKMEFQIFDHLHYFHYLKM